MPTSLDEVSVADLRFFFEGWPRKGYRETERLFERFLSDRHRLTIAENCQPRFRLKQQYLDRLRDLRGLAPRTLTHIDWAVTDFLTRCLASEDTETVLTMDAIETYFRARGSQLARQTFQHFVGSVRRFLRYGLERGMISEALHRFELPRSFRFEQPPRAVPWVQIEAMLALRRILLRKTGFSPAFTPCC